MKTKFSRRILAFVLMLALVVPMFVFNASAEEGVWTLVTDISQLVIGDKVIIASKASNYAMSTDQKSNNRGQASITKDTAKGTATLTSTVQQFELRAGSIAGTFAFFDGSKYLYSTLAGNNYLRSQATLDDKASWTISIASSGVATVKAGTGTTSSSYRNWMRYNSQSSLFSCYGSGQGDICLYKLVVDSATPSVSITGNDYLMVNGTLTLNANVSNVEGSVVWSSSNEEIATVVDGVVTGHKLGKVTITADVNGVYGLKELIIYPESSTISIAEAIEICKLTGTANTPVNYTVVASVESIDEAYSSSYNNITVTVTDGTNSIKVYRLKGGSDLKVGDTIKVTGLLVNYNGNTPEFNSGCTYEKLTTINDINSSMALAYSYEHEDGIYSNSNFAFKFTIDATVADIADITAYGIKVSAGGKDVYYNEDTAISWTEEDGKIYVIVELGDIINDTAKLETVFTVTAYVEVGGEILTSKNSTSYSVASIVAYYVDNLGLAEVEHLYDFISNEHGLI